MIGRISHLLCIACNNVVKAWVKLKLGDLHSVSDGFLEFQLATVLPSLWVEWMDHHQVHPPHATTCGLAL
jgi:hypothetical protein